MSGCVEGSWSGREGISVSSCLEGSWSGRDGIARCVRLRRGCLVRLRGDRCVRLCRWCFVISQREERCVYISIKVHTPIVCNEVVRILSPDSVIQLTQMIVYVVID